jgi:SNF2 family DNA or RNA helicase
MRGGGDFYVRRAVGVELLISRSYEQLDGVDSSNAPPLYNDGHFLITTGALFATYQSLTDKNGSARSALVRGETIQALIPERHPPILRVTRSANRESFFNFGELQRPRFLANPPEYPLKNHQLEGVRWLTSRHACILADDMGLGKTMQAIAAFDLLRQQGNCRFGALIYARSAYISD